MPNSFFKFKQFIVYHDRTAMKVTTDTCCFGAWAAIEMEKAKLKIKNVLDIGAGTGLLSLMIAQKNKVHIDAVEIDQDAAEQAKENVLLSPWKDQLGIYNRDILSFRPDKNYECIICNPPFYENELASDREKKNLAHHSTGLTIAQVLGVINQCLANGGVFFLLYAFKRKEQVERLITSQGLHLTEQVILRQSVNHAPFRTMVMGTNQTAGEINSREISIWNDKQQYTEEFRDLLKDYYLYL